MIWFDVKIDHSDGRASPFVSLHDCLGNSDSLAQKCTDCAISHACCSTPVEKYNALKALLCLFLGLASVVGCQDS